MRLFNESILHPWLISDTFWKTDPNVGNWNPAFDTLETEDAYLLRGDVPGSSSQDFSVKVESSVLTLQGERTLENKDTAMRYSRRERAYGKFVRRFQLPKEVDEAAIQASYVNGVLELRLPKKEPLDNTRLIPVN